MNKEIKFDYVIFYETTEKWYQLVGDWKSEDDLYVLFPGGFCLYTYKSENDIITENNYCDSQNGKDIYSIINSLEIINY